ncbi:hypothetical protein BDV95DRAFT_593238 [Massariosphaeria phaeospora]|uniref:Uncharacterized protein n=1 Tax=Massariosphaeria phaeospora TaxID=100035 RepID=A0A7C8IBB6_9PLEO|nr:hypothetical protein BDV95DRAFT_593238 [Massariosphaeria phaeospora]
MSSSAGRAAGRATGRMALRDTGAHPESNTTPFWKRMFHSNEDSGARAIRKGARRDPELYVRRLPHQMHSPTGADESYVAKVPDSEPWKSDDHGGKYKYYPENKPDKEAKTAPSALDTVIVPNVTLPKHLHDQYNKYGKEEFNL